MELITKEAEVVKDSSLELFSKWICEKTKDGRLVNEAQCASYLESIVSFRIFEKDIKTWVSRARKYAYSHLNHFIVKEQGKGWRIALTSDERENTCIKIMHISSRYMDNAFSAMNALNKDEFIRMTKKARATKSIGKTLKDSKSTRIDFDEQYITLAEKIAERFESNATQKQITN